MTLQQPVNGLLQAVAGRGDIILWATNENMTPRGPERQHGQVVWWTGISLVLQDSRQSFSLIYLSIMKLLLGTHMHVQMCVHIHIQCGKRLFCHWDLLEISYINRLNSGNVGNGSLTLNSGLLGSKASTLFLYVVPPYNLEHWLYFSCVQFNTTQNAYRNQTGLRSHSHHRWSQCCL